MATESSRAVEAFDQGMRAAYSRLPIAVYQCDQSGRLTFFNEKAVELWGRRPSLGDPTELWCGSYRLWLPDGSRLPHDETPMARAIHEGIPTRGTNVVIERPDGTRITVDVNIDPLCDADGNIIGAINAFQDVSERVRMEEALQSSERRYRELVQGMALAAYTTDAEGRITMFNDAAVALWGRQPEIGRDLWCGSLRIFTPAGEALPLDSCPMAVAIREDHPVRDIEILVERPDGSRISVLPYPTPLHDAEGQLIGAINVLVDMTERNRSQQERLDLLERERAAREEAEIAVRARDEFLSIASHELRNPVAAVHGIAQFLKRTSDRGHFDPGQVASYAGTLLESSTRLARLVNDLLDVGRLQSGQLRLELTAVDLRTLTEEIIEGFDGDGAHRFIPDYPEVLATVRIDPVRIRQVLENLFENALKYSPPEGQVRISLEVGADEVTMTVTDEGIGIPVSELGTIFEPFGRARNAAQAHIPGMGLGLFVSRQLIDAHGGTLTASSPGEGAGASFRLTLPRDE